MIKYRRIVLLAGQVFLGYLLFTIVDSTDAANKGLVWPLVMSFLVLFMLPEDRLQADTFARIIEALKGIKR